MRNLPRLFDRAVMQPVQILPSAHHGIVTMLLSILNGGQLATSPMPEARGTASPEGRGIKYQVIEGTAIIPLQGVMMKHASMMDVDCLGACCIEQVTERLELAEMDPRIDRIVLWVDSPGGEVTGTPELAAVVARIAASADTEIIAFTDSLMASAGYYVGSQANFVLATPSAQVGSINTYIYWVDQSRAFEKAGFDAKLFTEGKFKGMGAPGLPLTEEQETLLMDRVRMLTAEFHATVQAGRGGQLATDALEGQTFSGQGAVDAQLVDYLVADIDAAAMFEPGMD